MYRSRSGRFASRGGRWLSLGDSVDGTKNYARVSQRRLGIAALVFLRKAHSSPPVACQHLLSLAPLGFRLGVLSENSAQASALSGAESS